MRIDMAVRCTSSVIRASCDRLRPACGFTPGGQVRIVAHQRLRDHHLAHHVHQIIELARIHFDGSGALAVTLRRLWRTSAFSAGAPRAAGYPRRFLGAGSELAAPTRPGPR